MFGLGFVVWGLWIGGQPLDDNSFLTHLATGRLILDQGIPTADPYSFTAAGEPWVVQSWLVSVVFALAEQVAGAAGIKCVVMAAYGAAGGLVWMLTARAQGLVARIALAAMAVGVGAVSWAERPLLVGILGLCLVLLAVEERFDPRWLVPVMWIWVNSHGSFPLALVAVGCFAVGRRLDDGDWGSEVRVLVWVAVGTVTGVMGPLLLDALLFPAQLLSRSDALEGVIEWESPSFDTGWTRLYLVQVTVAVLLLVRRGSFRVAVPLVVFLAASLVASRNVTMASLVFLPGMAVGLRGYGRLTGRERTPAAAVGAAVMVGVGVLLAAGLLGGRGYDLGRYPVAAFAWMDDRGVGPERERVVSHDYVGNAVEFLYGPDGGVFLDDRFDMYPLDVTEDYVALLGGSADWEAILDDHEVDWVVWTRASSLSSLLVASESWTVPYVDDGWMVACRRSADSCRDVVTGV